LDEKDTAQKRTWSDRLKAAWAMSWIRTDRRRTIVRLVVIVALVVVFVVVPGYLATRPQFLQRYPNLQPEYKTWSVSVHAEVPCQSCHIAPTFVARTAFDARMLGEFYLSLVVPGRSPNLFDKPTNASCESCHLAVRTVSPSGDLNIPHRAHVELLKMRCITCHKYLVHEANPEGNHAPRMATCLTCHNGKVAKNGCSTCHTNKGIPVSHRAANWLVIHPQMQSKINCAACHAWTAHWCAECHSHRPASHGPNWREVHGAAVKANRDCEVCHTAAFCIRCHGAVPQLNFNPALKLVQ